jgi:hypothetical protein
MMNIQWTNLAQAGTILKSIREVPSSNIGRDTDYAKCFRDSSYSSQANFRYSLELGHESFVPQPFQFIIHHDPVIRVCVFRVIDSVVK